MTAASIQQSALNEKAAAPSAARLFEYAPPMALQSKLGLVGQQDLKTPRRALLVVLVSWAPLVVLSTMQTMAGRTEDFGSVMMEAGVHARYLIAAPLLVLAEATCIPRLNAIIRNFAEGALLAHPQRLDGLVASTKRLLKSTAAEIVAIVLAYLIVAGTIFSYPNDQIPLWCRSSGGILPVFSPAGWWHALVSLPLLLVLFFGWMWRLALWTRILWKISRLELRLIASHPDHAAGLAFVGHSVGAFSMVALAMATVAAGRSAHFVLEGTTLPTPNLILNATLLPTVLVLFVAPLFCFTPLLVRSWHRGSIEYGALAEQVGAAFEDKWLARRIEPSALSASDFSSTTDLYQIVSNVQDIRLVPLDIRDLITLVVMLLLPFVPVVLLAIPVDVILGGLEKLLL